MFSKNCATNLLPKCWSSRFRIFWLSSIFKCQIFTRSNTSVPRDRSPSIVCVNIWSFNTVHIVFNNPPVLHSYTFCPITVVVVFSVFHLPRWTVLHFCTQGISRPAFILFTSFTKSFYSIPFILKTHFSKNIYPGRIYPHYFIQVDH